MSGAALQGTVILVFLALGALLPRRDQPLVGRHTLVNLATGGLMFLVRVSLVEWVRVRADFGLLDLARVPWPALQLLVAFLALDFTRYWVHRLDHRLFWLWTFHRVHHSSEDRKSVV